MCRLGVAVVLWIIAIKVVAQNDTLPDWRIGLYFAVASTLWDTENNRLWANDQPLFVSGFYHCTHCALGDVQGRRKVLLPGVVLRNRRSTELGLAFSMVDYTNTEWEASYPARHVSQYYFLRFDYSRSTRPGSDQRPRFGFRWGGSLLVRDGSTSRNFSVNRPWMRWDVHQQVDATTILIQPTVSFGYRSRAVNAGIQVYWNLAAIAIGKVLRDERHWIHGDGLPYPVDIDEAFRFSEFVFADRLAQRGLFWSNLQLFMSIPLFSLAKLDQDRQHDRH